MNSIRDFLAAGISILLLYVLYFILAVVGTFLFGIPVIIGIKFALQLVTQTIII